MASPTVSHLDPIMMTLLDDVRARLARVYARRKDRSLFAVSGTHLSMETVVANLVKDGTRATVIVSGYFGDRLAQMCERYGATVDAPRRRVGQGVRSRGAAAAAEGQSRRCRAMVHAEPPPACELGARARRDRARTQAR